MRCEIGRLTNQSANETRAQGVNKEVYKVSIGDIVAKKKRARPFVVKRI